MTGTATWSPEPMLERLGGDEELARQLVTLFIAECPRMVDRIRESIAAGDADEIRKAAHAFKGSVANFTTNAPMTTALELETAARAANTAGAVGLAAQIEQELETLVAQLRSFEAGA
jgi:HPt (histidine-containing phosphotransfer) domain-containing protein